MSDNLTDAPLVEEEVPEDAEIPEDAPEDADPSDEDDGPAIEYKGGKYRVDPAVKEAYEAMQAETTRKFQEAAELKKSADAVKAEREKMSVIERQFYREIATVEGINEQLAQFDKVDWARWDREDQDAARNAKLDRIDLRDKRDELLRHIRQKIDEKTAMEGQEMAKRRSAAEQEIKTHIPDWSPQKQEVLGKLAENYGFSADEYRGLALLDPRMLRVLKDAEVGRRAQKSVATPPLKPVTVVPRVSGGGTPATKNPDKMSITEYNAWRDKQEAAKRKANGRR
jgi:hypothetical protein